MKNFLLFMTIATPLFISGCAQNNEQSTSENLLTEDGRVSIMWQNPADFSDVEATIGVQSKFEEYLFTQLTKELAKLANKHLSAQQKLELIVTNVDLAGDLQPTFGGTADEVRIVSDLYPPKIAFEYTLTDNGNVISSGSEKLKDMGYLMGIQQVGNDPFPYEADLLTDWFKKNIEPILAN